MSDTVSEIVDMTDAEYAAYIGQIDEKMKDNYDNDGDEDEYSELVGEKYAAKKQHEDAKKERDTRQKSERETLKAYDKEAAALEAKLAEGPGPEDDEAEIRARQAYVETRRSELTASLPFAGISTSTLEKRFEDAEYDREEVRAKLDQALAPGGKPSAHARRFQAELDAIDQNRQALSVEMGTRRMQEANKELAHAAAIRHAERELRAEDARAISEADPARRGTRTEDLAESFAARLSLRIPETEKRLLKEAEANVVRALADPGGAVDVGWRKHADKLRAEEAKIAERILSDEERIDYEHRVRLRSGGGPRWDMRRARNDKEKTA
jgi:hypothetical protein